jgi:hypothetical protein
MGRTDGRTDGEGGVGHCWGHGGFVSLSAGCKRGRGSLVGFCEESLSVLPNKRITTGVMADGVSSVRSAQHFSKASVPRQQSKASVPYGIDRVSKGTVLTASAT